MGYTAYFERGSSRISIDGTGRYGLALDFTPPIQTIDIYTAGGTSANPYGGAQKVGERAGNRPFTFGIRLLGPIGAAILPRLGHDEQIHGVFLCEGVGVFEPVILFFTH
jgi:hypothetical protein